MKTIKSKVRGVKDKLLDSEVKKMLKTDNPLQGIYGMYGDHPNEEDIKNSKKHKKHRKNGK